MYELIANGKSIGMFDTRAKAVAEGVKMKAKLIETRQQAGVAAENTDKAAPPAAEAPLKEIPELYGKQKGRNDK